MNKRTLKTEKALAFILFALYMGGVCLLAQDVPRSYIAQQTTEQLTIDGNGNEISWKRAKWSNPFIDIEGEKTPKYETKVKMLWDAQNLYFFAELEEPHVWGTLKQRDTVMFYNNDFEIFIDPNGDTHNYYELEVNALNTIWDLFLTKPYRNQNKVLDSWDIQGLRSAVQVKGTLNDPTDTDKGWTVEIAIPWKVLTEANDKAEIPENEFWRINFSRVNWEFDLKSNRYSRKKDTKTGEFLPEYNWVWSPQGVINMHEPEHWGYVYFSTDEVGSRSEFTIPEDEHIKWRLYELYSDLIDENNTKGKREKADGDIFGEPFKLFGKSITPVMEKSSYGYRIYAESPFSERKLLINDDGKFESHEAKKK